MERGRRNASRTDAAKEKLASLAAQKASGKKRVETFEAKREEAVYDEVRRGCARGCVRLRAVSRRELTCAVLARCLPLAPRSWTRSRTPTWWPSAAWRRAASWWATWTAGARGAALRGKRQLKACEPAA
jgi:hypothetical protein